MINIKKIEKRDTYLELTAKLLSRVIHDYNNFISPIDGYVSIIQMEIADSKEITEDLNEITETLKRVNEYREKLAGFYRINKKTEKKNLNLNELIHNFLEKYNNIKTDLTDNSNINANEDDIKFIFEELIKNSREHSNTNNLEILIKTEYTDENLVLTFEDNGKGIEESEMEKIFFPFYTRDSDKYDGLGLSYIWNICRRHNAYVICESEKNKYFRIKIVFIPQNRVLLF